jgi:DNA (cytosine-5)-methyltransferase 1
VSCAVLKTEQTETIMKAVDLFAGWGGFTEGATQAGVEVVWAANHWPLAVEAHAANHPRTAHACQDLQQADWSMLPRYDLLLASPACQGHSQAAQPGRRASGHVRHKHDELRSTAWAVIGCLDVTRPRYAIIENVPDFLRWDAYPAFLHGLRCFGYKVQELRVLASHCGVPQRRERVFLICDRRKQPRIEIAARPEPAFGPCIDWDAPDAWRPIDERPRVLERILRSRKRYGKRFLTQHTRDHMGVPLSQPIRTITTKDQWALVDGDFQRRLTITENLRAMGCPPHFKLPAGATRTEIMRGLGNMVPPPVARELCNLLLA